MSHANDAAADIAETTFAHLPADLRGGLPTLHTARLTLRQLQKTDIPDLFRIFSDPAVTRYWSREPLVSTDEATALFEEIESGRAAAELFQWGIADRSTDQVVGTTTIYGYNAVHRRAELGFALASSVWNRGYGSEAVEAIVAYAFGALQLHRMEADVDPRNTASRRILERAGFVEEGYLRERYHMYGELQDAVIMGLLRADWLRRPIA